MAEVIKTVYPKRFQNKAIEEGIKLAMAQFKEQKDQIMADKIAKQNGIIDNKNYYSTPDMAIAN
jgi:hypothetical protein